MEGRFSAALCRLLEDGSSSVLPAHAQGCISRQDARFLELLEKGSIPTDGWEDEMIEHALLRLAAMDANNSRCCSGVGEREGRLFSRLVRRRHFGLAHGIGRSGDIAEVQPKAVGSALIQKLTTKMAAQALRIAGVRLATAARVLVMPVATGMALSLVLHAVAATAGKPRGRFVLVPRIDQKSCLKSVAAAGLQLVLLPNCLEGDKVCTSIADIERSIAELGPDTIVAVLSTSSCFAPRVCDRLVSIGRLCRQHNIAHVVNNAYGLQSSHATHQINETIRHHRLDALVQSTDKNFMVPVGGSLIAATAELALAVSQLYPGRASMSPIADLFITLLSMGVRGYQQLLAEQKVGYAHLKRQLEALQSRHPVRVLETKHNDVSLALDLGALPLKSPTMLGSQLFVRGVSGARVVVPSLERTVAGHRLASFGAHHDAYPHAYLTAAAAVGQTTREIDLFVRRLEKLLRSTAKKLE